MLEQVFIVFWLIFFVIVLFSGVWFVVGHPFILDNKNEDPFLSILIGAVMSLFGLVGVSYFASLIVC